MQYVDKLRRTRTGPTTNLGTLLAFAVIGLVLLSFLVIGLSAVAAADEDENGPALEVNVSYESSDDPLELEVAFNDSIDDEDAVADVLFYEAGGNESDPVETETIEANAGQTVSQTFDWGEYDGLEYGDEYTVVVEDGDHLEYADRLDGGLFGGGGGGADGVPGFGAVVAIVALATAGGLAMWRG